MNEKLLELFYRFQHLRVVETIVAEIIQMDNYVYNFVEDEAITLIDYYLTKYNKEIKEIGHIYQNRVVIEDNPHAYDTKNSEEVNSDVEYVRDCLIMIGAVRSGIRRNFREIVEEIEE